MKHNNLRLAIYGKGGIGKSTIAANLAAAFTTTGRSVLQIGCDPKHDSTRLLLGGRKIETVLEHLEQPANQADMIRFRRKLFSPEYSTAKVAAAGKGLPEGLERQNVLHEGFGGALCIEAGGPKPGVGCAGRGIITTFELLDKLKVDPDEFDVVLYDVLGDVVCGGFGVPMRHEHANALLLVTSEEYMPIYAANNILRGVQGYDRQEQRLTGLFLNRRDNQSSRSLVERFSAVAELPIVAELPRSPIVQQADHLGKTLAEAFPESDEVVVFHRLAEHLLDEFSPRYCAKPMTDEELEFVVLGRRIETDKALVASQTPSTPRKRATTGEPHCLAVYGKGGIGKSTVAANISATLASCGLRVLQIGCDPKHDSTRLLLGGRTVRTVLEYLRDVSESDRRLAEVVHEGVYGIHCVEVGGPEPGVGCAGRGILSAFTLLEKLGLRNYDYDVIVYDVLGDVVCGGFAIPMRKGYAQSILLVTSEEYMPLYAANNILRGINGVVGVAPRVAGVFHNVRDNDADFTTVERFAQATDLPILSRLNRSPTVQDAEQLSRPLAMFAPQSPEAKVFDDLAGRLLDHPPHVPAVLLSDAQLDEIILGRSMIGMNSPNGKQTNYDNPRNEASTFTQSAADMQFCNIEELPDEPFFYRTKPIRQPIWCCAFQTATRTALRMRDAVVVAHAPRSCAYMCRAGICSGASKDLKRRKKYRGDMMRPNLVCTDMTVPHMIYGGTELLTQTLKEVLQKKPPIVFLTTACPPAIIGDDIAAAIRQAQPVSPETRIIPLRTDGNMTGGGMNGHLSAMFDGLLSVVDASPDEAVQPRSVNLIGNWLHDQSRTIRHILTDVGLSINASFSVNDRDPRVEDLRLLNRAPLTLIGSVNILTTATAKYLRERFGTELAQYPFPKGFRETAMWLRDIGEFFGIERRIEEYLAPHQAAYEKTIARCRRVLAGKRVVVFYWNHPMNWILDVMLDCGIDVAFVGMMVREEDIRYPFRYRDRLPVEFGFHPDRRHELLEAMRPDAVFTSTKHDLPDEYTILDTAGVTDDDAAFEPGNIVAHRWASLMTLNRSEQWRRDFVPEDKRLTALARQSEERTTR